MTSATFGEDSAAIAANDEPFEDKGAQLDLGNLACHARCSPTMLPSVRVPFLALQADNAKQAAEASQARLAQIQERCAAEEARLAALQVRRRS